MTHASIAAMILLFGMLGFYMLLAWAEDQDTPVPKAEDIPPRLFNSEEE